MLRASERNPVDSLKSIAIPVTRKRAAGKPRKAGHPAPPADSRVGGTVGPLRRVSGAISIAPQHRYRIGERLMMQDGGRSLQRAKTTCRVISLLPAEGGPLRYRVRSETESFERVVEEGDLSR